MCEGQGARRGAFSELRLCTFDLSLTVVVFQCRFQGKCRSDEGLESRKIPTEGNSVALPLCRGFVLLTQALKRSFYETHGRGRPYKRQAVPRGRCVAAFAAGGSAETAVMRLVALRRSE